MIPDGLLDDLKRDEGCRLVAYQDTLGIPTIGYGHTGPEVKEGLAITQEIADQWLLEDTEKHCADLDMHIPWWQQRPNDIRRGLGNMAFNLGWPRLSGFHNMLAALDAKDYERAASEALASTWGAQVGDRAKRIAALFHGP